MKCTYAACPSPYALALGPYKDLIRHPPSPLLNLLMKIPPASASSKNGPQTDRVRRSLGVRTRLDDRTRPALRSLHWLAFVGPKPQNGPVDPGAGGRVGRWGGGENVGDAAGGEGGTEMVGDERF